MNNKYHLIRRSARYCCFFACLLGSLVACRSENKQEGTDSSNADSISIPTPVSLQIPPVPESYDTLHIGKKVFYVSEGDVLLTRDTLKARLSRLFSDSSKFDQKWISLPRAIMYRGVNGELLKWRKFPITYCIDKSTFQGNVAQYENFKSLLSAAISDWGKVCKVSFDYKSALDVKVNVIPDGSVDFVVKKQAVDKNDRLAFSFAPETLLEDRLLLIYPIFFTAEADKIGVLRHELGHMFGFRHEQQSLTAKLPPSCKSPVNPLQTDLSVWDQRSIMHYFCKGKGNRFLTFSKLDSFYFKQQYPFN